MTSRASQSRTSRTKPPSIQCSQCLEHFKDPRLLDCYHSFCTECLKFYVEANEKNGTFLCPLCKTEITLPVDGVEGLSKNYYIISLSEKNVAKCDICGEKAKADFTCIDCTQNYCSFCIKFHSKLQGTKTHRVASVDENGIRKVKQTTALCRVHPKLELTYFCDTCQELVCIDCNMTNHKTHECQSIDESVVKFKERLQSAFNGEEHEAIVTTLQSIRRDLIQKTHEGSDDHETLLASIESQAKEFHKLIDDIKSEMASRIMDSGSMAIKNLKDKTADIDRRITSFEALIQFSKLMLTQANDVDIVMHGAKLAARVEMIKTEKTTAESEKPRKSLLQFEKRDLMRQNVEEMFGKLFDPNEDVEQNDETEDIVLEEFLCKDQDGIITGIAPCGDDKAWISFGNDGILQQYTATGKCLRSLEVGHKVDDLVQRGNDLYISCNARKKILVYDGKSFVTFTRTSSCARGLAVSVNAEHIFVGLTEKDVFYNCSDQPSASLIKVNRDKKQKKAHGVNSMKYPARIAVSTTGNIVISDWIALQIISMDTEGNEVYTFNGVDEKTDFIPRGVCCGPKGVIYVIDAETDAVLKLGADGQLIGKLKDIDKCWSLAMDDKGRLWVGSQEGKVTILQDKGLYQL